MSREDLQKLLGGYATGTLTEAEQQALFEAALEDQQLFDALAREQALRDVLADPAARRQALAALEDRPAPAYWRWWRPAAVGLATAGIAVVAFIMTRPAPRALETAMVSPAEFPRTAPPPEAPVSRTELSARPRKAAQTPAPRSTQPEAPPPLPPAPEVAAIQVDAAAPKLMLQSAPPAPQAKAEQAAAPAQAPATFGFRDHAAEARGAPLRTSPPGGVVGGVIGGVPGGAAGALMAPPAPPPQTARSLYYGMAGGSGGGGGRADTRAMAGAMPGAMPGARPIAPLATSTGRIAPGYLGVRYSFLRTGPLGQPVEIGAEELREGESVRLRFTPNQRGYLSVAVRGASAPLVPATLVEALQPLVTLALPVENQELVVTFARENAPEAAALAARGATLTETPAGEKTTYVVNPAARAAQQLVFTISLKRS